MPFYERQPYIQPVHQIIKELMRGEIQVPQFQRPGTESTWRPQQRGDLLDSLYRGFPVGTILLWSTNIPIRAQRVVGGFQIPQVGDSRVRRLLLDGHQRLSSLVQLLGPGLCAELGQEGIPVGLDRDNAQGPSLQERWVFELSPTKESGQVEGKGSSSRERFILLKEEDEPKPTQVPLSIVLDRGELNRWIRKHSLSDTLIREADNLRDRLREYSMPVAVLAADSLREATESFKRINSSGAEMSDFHMVRALAYEDAYDPQERFDEMRSTYLGPIGWGDVSDTDVLRVLAGLDPKKSPLNMDVDELAHRIRNDQKKRNGASEGRDLIELAFEAVAEAAKLFKTCGVVGPETLPYTWQLITLAVHIGRSAASGRPLGFTDSEIPHAQRWFWLTTYGEVFAGINSAVVVRSLRALESMINGGGWEDMSRDVSRQVRALESFDFRTARSKATALAMARLQDQDDRSGPAHRALAIGASSMQVLFPGGKRSRWWHLAIVTEEVGLSLLRDALRRPLRQDNSIDTGKALSVLGLDATDTGNVDRLLNLRQDRLLKAEGEFVGKLGLIWASPKGGDSTEGTVGSPDGSGSE